MAPKAIILMADYGNDPTEVAVPFDVFKKAGFDVAIATENGAVPECDKRMYSGLTGKLLGANKAAVGQHSAMVQTTEYKSPVAWTKPGFTLADYDVVFLPGGHDKGMQQFISSPSLHSLLAEYVPQTKRGDPAKKSMAAICHGVQVLVAADLPNDKSKSVIHDFETTALPGFFEQSIYWVTRPFLGAYYKTVRKRLDNADKQYKNSLGGTPFTHKDPNYNYISGRFPPDADKLAKETVALVEQTLKA